MLEATRNILGDLIAYETVSSDSNLEMIAYLSARLSAVGASVETVLDETAHKASIFARMGPDGPGGVMLSGHTDVVPVEDQDWTGDPFTLREAEGLLYGRGACDMKGFIAACVALAEALDADRLARPLHFAFTYDEEVGCLGARQLVDHLRERDDLPALAVIGEPTEMRIVDAHKGCCEYTTRFHGLEGHGSAPDLGVNAVDYAIRFAGRLHALRDGLKARAPAASRFDPPWTTVNIGKLSGGVAHNVIAGRAELEWEMRPVQPGDLDFVKDDLDAYTRDVLLPEMRAVDPDAAIETEAIGEIQGLSPMSGNEAAALVMALTGANETHTVAFGTEAGLFQTLGMDVVVCGPGSIEQAHKADEFVSMAQLRACTEMLAGLGRRL